MRRRSRSAVIIASALLVAALGGTGQAQQAGVYVVSVAASQFYGYATPVIVVQQGGELGYANLDIVQHDVVQDVKADGIYNKKRKGRWCKSFKKKECPLFWSARAGLGDTVPVEGLDNVEPGQVYTFFCTLHPGMKGSLIVSPA